MSDIKEAVIQDEIASSLLSPAEQEAEQHGEEQPASEYAAHGDDLLNEEIEDRQTDPFRDPDTPQDRPRLERLRSERSESEEKPERGQQRRQPAPEGQEQQQAQVTPVEQDQESLRAIDSVVDQYELNDSALGKEAIAGFCETFNISPYESGFNVEQFGRTEAKSNLLAFHAYDSLGGDLSKIPTHIPAGVASAYSWDFVSSLNIDPRLADVDAQALGDVAYQGKLSIIDGFNRNGWDAPLSKINTPEASEYYFGRYLQAFRIDPAAMRAQMGPDAYRKTALKLADTEARSIRGFKAKVDQINQRQAQARQGQGDRSSNVRARGQRIPAGLRDGIRGRKGPRFVSNQDIFTPDLMDDRAMRRL